MLTISFIFGITCLHSILQTTLNCQQYSQHDLGWRFYTTPLKKYKIIDSHLKYNVETAMYLLEILCFGVGKLKYMKPLHVNRTPQIEHSDAERLATETAGCRASSQRAAWPNPFASNLASNPSSASSNWRCYEHLKRGTCHQKRIWSPRHIY